MNEGFPMLPHDGSTSVPTSDDGSTSGDGSAQPHGEMRAAGSMSDDDYVSGDGSTQLEKKPKRERFLWSSELHEHFEHTIRELGLYAKPKAILAHMRVPGLGQLTVKSHLQKYRRKTEAIESKQREAIKGLTLLGYAEGEAPPPSDSDEDNTQVGVNEVRAPDPKEAPQGVGTGRWHTLPVPNAHFDSQPLSNVWLAAQPMNTMGMMQWKPHLLDHGVQRLDPWGSVAGWKCDPPPAAAKKPRAASVSAPIPKIRKNSKQPCYLTKW